MSMESKSLQININFRVLPFGRGVIEIKGSEQEEKKKRRKSLYIKNLR